MNHTCTVHQLCSSQKTHLNVAKDADNLGTGVWTFDTPSLSTQTVLLGTGEGHLWFMQFNDEDALHQWQGYHPELQILWKCPKTPPTQPSAPGNAD